MILQELRFRRAGNDHVVHASRRPGLCAPTHLYDAQAGIADITESHSLLNHGDPGCHHHLELTCEVPVVEEIKVV